MSFSVVTAVHDPLPEHLDACLRSVRDQLAAGDRHVVVDDASRAPAVVEVLDEAARSGSITLVRRPEQGGIVAASNVALAAADGAWLVLVDHDDVLAPGALASLRAVIAADPDTDVWYGDHILLRPDGRLADPVYKPDFSPERLRSTNYITHLVCARRACVDAVGGFTAGLDGAQDHDLLLRLMETGVPFGHVPEILYHWRQSPASVATDVANKPAAFDRGREAVEAHVRRTGIDAAVTNGPYAGVYVVARRARDDAVSVVVPTRGSAGTVWGVERTFVVEAVRSLAERSTHADIEFAVVADAATPGPVVDSLRRIGDATGRGVSIVEFDGEFNFSRKINAGVAVARSDRLLLLNDDTELIDRDSVAVMSAHLDAGDHGGVGVVGAKLLYSDGTLQHGGHVYHQDFMHACIGWPGDHPGPQRALAVERECSGVTAAALMTTRAVFEEVDGFPEQLPLHFNDVYFSLSVRDTGRRIVWTPRASWYHFEGRTRRRGATMAEYDVIDRRWHHEIHHDPYYNPNLAPRRADWLELPGRSGAPPYVVIDGVKHWA